MNAKNAGKKSTKALQTKSNNGMLITVAALIAIAILVLGGVIFFAQRGGESNPIEFGQSADPQVEITEQGVVAVGDSSAPTVQIWEDFMCPACGQFEAQFGERLAQEVQDGDLHVEYHMLNFMDRQSGSGGYSTRALAAVQCSAANDSIGTFFDVKNAFFAQQPSGGGDLTPSQLADAAESAGANDESVACIGNVETNGGTDKASETASNSQRSIQEVTDNVSTPTVAHEGETVEFSNPAWIDEILS